MPAKTLRTCENGHEYFKSSDCPVCPRCEEERKLPGGFLSSLASPARRALENNGVFTPAQLACFTQNEILKWHGLGPGSLPKLQKILADHGLNFRIDK